MSAVWLDGNAIAGLLWELFGTEMTAAPRGCHSCGAVRPIATHRLYRGAGLVLRCPECDEVAMRLTTLPDCRILELAGQWRVPYSP
jgi:hypothetical protein